MLKQVGVSLLKALNYVVCQPQNFRLTCLFYSVTVEAISKLCSIRACGNLVLSMLRPCLFLYGVRHGVHRFYSGFLKMNLDI